MSTAAAKERPILFSSAMVRAILEGRKTQHRTVVRLLPSWTAQGITHGDLVESGWWVSPEGWQYGDEIVPCPYGKVGDRIWVRENFQPLLADGDTSVESRFKRANYKTGEGYQVSYPATDGVQEYYDCGTDEAFCDKVTPSIHMPRWASRLTLEIVKVRVERLQEISEEDAYAEGVSDDWPLDNLPYLSAFGGRAVLNNFAYLWNSINAKRDGGKYVWSANPWVWALEFKRVQP